jgi:hypothetical protein
MYDSPPSFFYIPQKPFKVRQLFLISAHPIFRCQRSAKPAPACHEFGSDSRYMPHSAKPRLCFKNTLRTWELFFLFLAKIDFSTEGLATQHLDLLSQAPKISRLSWYFGLPTDQLGPHNRYVYSHWRHRHRQALFYPCKIELGLQNIYRDTIHLLLPNSEKKIWNPKYMGYRDRQSCSLPKEAVKCDVTGTSHLTISPLLPHRYRV